MTKKKSYFEESLKESRKRLMVDIAKEKDKEKIEMLKEELEEVERLLKGIKVKEKVKEMENRIREKLQENHIYASVWIRNNGNIAVEIEWGDWKHEHLATDLIVERLGGTKAGETITEEDGSDTYSSIHYFYFG